MIVRDYKGKLVYFNIDKYSNEKDMYIDLWKITYNVTLPYTEGNENENILKYLKN
jgi:hypothetical protein|uniref:Uncharacterized protein n=1 Tax=viral metagenome TaxID=1070528 RepID=A0A6C0BYD8_9ZZZZ|tara:strand:- start:111 stop:275 length:165 start_codon:yes stop_codon:yes gene_type:complete